MIPVGKESAYSYKNPPPRYNSHNRGEATTSPQTE